MARSREEPASIAARDRAMIDRYLAMLAAERGAARNTLLAYRNDLEDAAGVLGNLADADAGGLTRLGRGWAELAPSSLARKSSALRGFFIPGVSGAGAATAASETYPPDHQFLTFKRGRTRGT